jgi:Ni/Fe-hydrogenase subunit HybB-like protein
LKRLLITLPSATVPLIGDVWGTVQITWVAIVITLGAAAAIPLGLMVIFRFVPILAVHEMAEVDAHQASAQPSSRRPVRAEAMP